MTAMQRPKEIALALLAAALVAGGALGYAAGRYTAAREGAPGERGSTRRYLTERLDLTPAQAASVDTILDARRKEMTRLITPVQPQLDSARNAARQRIMAILTPEQQRRFQELLAAHDRQSEGTKK
jgi:Spy/CpxP family protein refolding chaperone